MLAPAGVQLGHGQTSSMATRQPYRGPPEATGAGLACLAAKVAAFT